MVYQWLDQRVTHKYDPQRLRVVGDSDLQTRIHEKSHHRYLQWVTGTGYPGRLRLVDRLGNTLREKLLPAPHPPNPLAYSLEPHPEDIEWKPVTRNEVCTAIFRAKAHNTPGISRMTGMAYQHAWKVASEEIFLILHTAAEVGYHPEMFRCSICIVP